MPFILIVAGLVGLGRYLWIVRDRQQNPGQIGPLPPWADALTWGLGAGAGVAAVRSLVRAGWTPIPAAAATALGSAVVAAFPPPLRGIGTGGVIGSGAGLVATGLVPNWTLGMKPRLFVSHAFRDTPAYETVRALFTSANLSFFDHSVPVYEQFPTRSADRLRDELGEQIRGTSAVIYLAGPGVEMRPAVREEIEMAIAAEKPVLVVDQSPSCDSRLPAFLTAYPLKERTSLDADEMMNGLVRLLAT